MRRSGRSRAFRIRIASIITAEPEELSVAPVPPCQVSKWAPMMTSSSALSVPGISAMTLKELRFSSWKVLRMSSSIRTVSPISSSRAIRP